MLSKLSGASRSSASRSDSPSARKKLVGGSCLLSPTTIANFTAGQGPGWLTVITTQLNYERISLAVVQKEDKVSAHGTART